MAVSLQYEQGPIRPPSEAGSLLIRVTRNCPWNKCVFCSTYKRKKFSRRSMEEIKADIDAAKSIMDEIKQTSWSGGSGGDITRQVINHFWNDPSYNDCYRSVSLWLAHGAETVFLQDANSMMLSTDNLVTLLNYIKKTFPSVKRITSYARAITLKQKSTDDFKRLKEAGLTRLHMGMESGSDVILKMIQKGCTARHIVEGGKHVVDAGLSLCMYIIPGIGGKDRSTENAMESARVVNAVNPDFVRFRSLYVKGRSPLGELVDQGKFEIPSEDDIVQEIRLFIENLEGVTTTLVSDHMLNLLQELEGKLPEDKERMLAIIDSYLTMPEDERLMFQLARRGGALTFLQEFNQPAMKARLREAKNRIEQELPGGVPEYIREIKRQFV